MKEKAIQLVHLFLLLASEWLCPLPLPAAAANEDDGSDDTFFHLFSLTSEPFLWSSSLNWRPKDLQESSMSSARLGLLRHQA